VSRDRVFTQIDHQQVEVGARAAALALVFTLTVLTGTGADHPLSLLMLAALAVAAVLPVRNRTIRRWRPAAEEAAAAAIIASTQPYDKALLPYLVVPALSAGLLSGWSMAVITTGAGAIVLMSRGLVEPEVLADTDYLVDAAQWSLLALAVGLLGAWLRRVQNQRSSDADSYAQASRLLGQLRNVSRQLSGGLDSVSLARGELESLRASCPFDGGTVFVRSPGGLMVLLAAESWTTDTGWQPDLDKDTTWAAAWRTGEPHRSDTGLCDDPSRSSLVLPLQHGDRMVGLVGLERASGPFELTEVAAAVLVLAEGAARLDAALLFDEVRDLATNEERRRVAREIHDGIAQELAVLGYAVDDLTAESGGDRPEIAASLRELRGEISRIITELRLSIFDLRTDLGPGMSLNAALADHARAVGSQSGLTVHLELAETPGRLRVETETELLRIAQEAIANARKHAGAQNLWVTCRIDPPHVVLRISDDGRGVGPGRQDSFGFEIMAERTARIGGRLSISPRTGGGTVVELTTVPDSEGGRHGDPRAARR
jgi:signal transduction histidine kinase